MHIAAIATMAKTRNVIHSIEWPIEEVLSMHVFQRRCSGVVAHSREIKGSRSEVGRCFFFMPEINENGCVSDVKALALCIFLSSG
jgi:hypothetical protein